LTQLRCFLLAGDTPDPKSKAKSKSKTRQKQSPSKSGGTTPQNGGASALERSKAS